jgi:hypothetical protein
MATEFSVATIVLHYAYNVSYIQKNQHQKPNPLSYILHFCFIFVKATLNDDEKEEITTKKKTNFTAHRQQRRFFLHKPENYHDQKTFEVYLHLGRRYAYAAMSNNHGIWQSIIFDLYK